MKDMTSRSSAPLNKGQCLGGDREQYGLRGPIGTRDKASRSRARFIKATNERRHGDVALQVGYCARVHRCRNEDIGLDGRAPTFLPSRCCRSAPPISLTRTASPSARIDSFHAAGPEPYPGRQSVSRKSERHGTRYFIGGGYHGNRRQGHLVRGDRTEAEIVPLVPAMISDRADIHHRHDVSMISVD